MKRQGVAAFDPCYCHFEHAPQLDNHPGWIISSRGSSAFHLLKQSQGMLPLSGFLARTVRSAAGNRGEGFQHRVLGLDLELDWPCKVRAQKKHMLQRIPNLSISMSKAISIYIYIYIYLHIYIYLLLLTYFLLYLFFAPESILIKLG